MWFKDTGRILQACARMTHQEIGVLYCLIGYAWTKQGITESDLDGFATEQRVSSEAARVAWADFTRLAIEKDGRWLLPEQWEGLESHQKAKQKATDMARSRWDARRMHTASTQDACSIHTASTQDAVSNADLDLDLENTTVMGGVNNAHARVAPPLSQNQQPVTQAAAEAQQQVALVMDWLVQHYQLPLYANQQHYETASTAICHAILPGREIQALTDFFQDTRGKPVKLRFLPEDFSAWLAAKKQEHAQRATVNQKLFYNPRNL